MKLTAENHKGLAAVQEWSYKIHGKSYCVSGSSDRHNWIMATAEAAVNNTTPPDPLMEGSTNKVWRATRARKETIFNILFEANKCEDCGSQLNRIPPFPCRSCDEGEVAV